VVVVVPEVALDRILDEVQVLLPDRQVESEPVLDQGNGLRCRLPAGQRLRHVAGGNEEQAEDRHRDEPEDEDAVPDPANQKDSHD
jgi:hypothetical protein